MDHIDDSKVSSSSPRPAAADSLSLLLRIKTGDKAAVDALFRRYSDRLLRVVRLRLGHELRSKVESMDVLQEVFADAMEPVSDFVPQSEGALLHWLSTRVENKIREIYRRFRAGKRDLRSERPLDVPGEEDDTPFIDNRPGGDKTPSKIMQFNEDVLRVERALDTLSDEHKELLILKMYEDLTFEEIARLKGKNADAVRKTVSRAIDRLSTCLQGE